MSRDNQTQPHALLNQLLLPIFIGYAILVLAGAANHESWADEAQAWLLVRDNSIAELFSILPTEGHPPLWYLLIFPIVKLGLPYESIKFLSTIIAIAAVLILLFRTRLNIILKLFIPFSSAFIYEYSVFGRSYCLVLFFISAIISLYPYRFEKPWLFAACVAGLFNTHVLVFTFCMALVILYVTDALQEKRLDKKLMITAAFMLLSGLYLLPYLATNEMVTFFQSRVDHNDLRLQNTISKAIAPGYVTLSVILLIIFSLLLVQRIKPFFLLLTGIAGAVYILAYRYTGNEKHAAVLFMIMLATAGIANNYKNDFKLLKTDTLKWQAYLIALIVCIQFAYSYSNYVNDIDRPYSASMEAAQFIKDNQLDTNIIVAYWSGSASAILPYMDKDIRFYSAECGRYGSYQVYDSCYRQDTWYYPVDYALKVAHDNFADQLDKVILVLHTPVLAESEKYLDLLYKPSDSAIIWSENYHIYKFKPNVR